MLLPLALILGLTPSVSASTPTDDPPPFGPQLHDLSVPLVGPRLSICDLDGDGAQELLIAGGDGVLVHAVLGPGVGIQFESANVPTYVRHAIAADLDGDGLEEVVVAGAHLYVFPNGGGFDRLGSPWTAGQGKHASVAAADVDSDGDLDLIATTSTGLRTYLNDGTHGFQIVSQVDDGTDWGVLGECDFDGDGVPDVAGLRSGTVRVRLGDGQGAWGLPIDHPLSSTAMPIRFGDVNGDGIRDLAVGSSSSLGVPRLLLGAGDGTFVDGPSLSGTYYATYAYGFAALALDEDPADELLIADALGIHRVDDPAGEPVLSRWPVAGVHEFAALRSTTGADAHVVGLVEVDSVNAWTKFWGLALYDAGSVRDSSWFLDSTPSQGLIFWEPVDVDLNGDGHLDRLDWGTASDPTVVRLGSPQGWTGGEYALGEDVLGSRPLDVDGDGDSDLLAAVYVDSAFRFEVSLNDGHGRFTSKMRYAQGFDTNWTPMVLGDFDADGRDDVGIVEQGAFLALLSQEGGAVSVGAVLAGLSLPSVIADLDLDGHLDFAFSGAPTGQIALGDGRGGVRDLIPAPNVPGQPNKLLAAGDLDGDGLPEFVVRVGSAFQAQLAVFPGLGNAAWGSPRLLGPQRKLGSAQIVDVDGDARADLLLGVSGGSLILRNTGEGRLEPWSRPAWRAQKLAVHDVDGDGSPELLGPDGILTRRPR